MLLDIFDASHEKPVLVRRNLILCIEIDCFLEEHTIILLEIIYWCYVFDNTLGVNLIQSRLSPFIDRFRISVANYTRCVLYTAD